MSRVRRTVEKSWAALICVTLFLPSIAVAKIDSPPCGSALKNLPSRSPAMPSGSYFVRSVGAMSESEREKAIEAEFSAGNMPSFLARFVPVHLSGQRPNGTTIQITICVAPDYLAIGSDVDFMFTPMRLATALRIARRYGAMLPTSKMVDAIYDQASVHLSPQPLPAGDQMRSTAYYAHHNVLVGEQRGEIGASLGELTAGDKKDLVITNRLWRLPDRVAIYGWHRGSHQPIQPLSTVHGARYADYSHGVRLIGAEAYVDGEPRSLLALLDDPQLAPILNGEGAINRVTELVAELSIAPAEAVASSATSATKPGLAALGMRSLGLALLPQGGANVLQQRNPR